MSKLNKAAEPKQATLPVPHKHHDAIVAWSLGYEIQKRHVVVTNGTWIDVRSGNPAFSTEVGWEYRKKPDPVKDIVICRQALLQSSSHGDYFTHALATTSFNVRYTFDGETKKLKAVELLE